MTREDIIRMAREAGMQGMLTDVVCTHEELERFAALVAEHERERIITKNAPEIEKINAHIKTLAAEREKVAQWMTRQGYATGHGDTVEDLLKELEWQIRESEREACAKLCETLRDEDGYACWGTECAAAIRARGQA